MKNNNFDFTIDAATSDIDRPPVSFNSLGDSELQRMGLPLNTQEKSLNISNWFDGSKSSHSSRQDDQIPNEPVVQAEEVNNNDEVIVNPEYTDLLALLPEPILPEVQKALCEQIVRWGRTKDLHHALTTIYDIYLPPYEAKRVSYGYLVAVMANKYLAIKNSCVRVCDPKYVSSRITKAQLAWELQEIATGLSLQLGLYEPYPSKEFLINMLYTLKPEHPFFPSLRQPPDNRQDLAQALQGDDELVPLPPSFRGVVRITRRQLADQVERTGAGGDEAGAEFKRRLAILSADFDVLFRRAFKIRKFFKDYPAFTMKKWFERLLNEKRVMVTKRRR